MTNQQIIDMIESNGGMINTQIINLIISLYTADFSRRYTLWQEYKGFVPILTRTFSDPNRINNKIATPFRKQITEQKVGYFLGTPISYTVEEADYSPDVYESITDEIKKFNKRNHVDKLDAQSAEYASVCGVAYRLLYIDTNGKERATNIEPFRAVVIKDNSTQAPTYGLIQYLRQYEDERNQVYTRTKIYFYDKVNFYDFEDNGSGAFELIEVKPHMFTGCMPLIEIPNTNSNLLQGDWELSRPSMDAYDLLLSDAQNDIDENTLSYMIYKGITLTKEEAEAASKSRSIFLPDTTQEISFLTKTDNSLNIENQKKTLETNILKYSSAVDMSDEKFAGGGQSGESRKWKLTQLENVTKMKEREFSEALEYQFMCLCQAWNQKEIPLDYMDVEFQFTRTLPLEIKTAADANAALLGTISDKLRISLLPFVPDVEEELEQQKVEKLEANVMNLDAINLPVDKTENGDFTVDSTVDKQLESDSKSISKSSKSGN